jgi:polyisoprenoid-binding protein YceI
MTRHLRPSSLDLHPLAALALLVFTLPLHAAPPQTFTITSGQVGFHLEDTLEEIDADTKKVSGAVSADLANITASSVTLTVNTASLDSGMQMRDDDMRETYLETKKFPTATFKSTNVTGPASLEVGQSADLRVAGDLTLHGVTRRIVVPVHVTLESPKRAHLTSKFTIRMSDYNVTIPEKLVLAVANEVDVKFDLIATVK